LLAVWWLALHGLLLAAVALVGAAWWVKILAALALAAHGFMRRPAAAPTPILVAEDGSCCVPALDARWLATGPRTRLSAYWLRLSLVGGVRTHDILLCVDHVVPADWARLNARLRRSTGNGTAGAAGAQRTGQADLS
jgi:hypothetical protein